MLPVVVQVPDWVKAGRTARKVSHKMQSTNLDRFTANSFGRFVIREGPWGKTGEACSSETSLAGDVMATIKRRTYCKKFVSFQ